MRRTTAPIKREIKKGKWQSKALQDNNLERYREQKESYYVNTKGFKLETKGVRYTI